MNITKYLIEDMTIVLMVLFVTVFLLSIVASSFIHVFASVAGYSFLALIGTMVISSIVSAFN